MNNVSRPLRVGVVGCGSFGRHAYSDNVVDHPDANLIAVCDVDEERAETVARELFEAHPQRPRAATHTDYQEMFDQESLDVVMVGTMADIRPTVTIAALKSGAHVLAAKPMAPSLADAEAMLQAAEQADRMLMVGYNFRFRKDAQAAHNFINSGGVGTPRFARTWIHAGSVPVWGPHYIKSRSGGGSLASTGVHTLDLGVWFLGCPPLLSVEGRASARFADLSTLPSELEAVRDTYDVEDLVSGYVTFADDITLSVESMWLAPPKARDNGVDVWGTEGYASLSPFRLLTWREGDYVDVTEDIAPGIAETFQDNPRVRTRTEALHFIDCALGKTSPLIAPQEMWTDQAIVDGIYAGGRSYS